jgi:hypothetical protein
MRRSVVLPRVALPCVHHIGAFVVADMGFIEGATKRRGVPCRVYATSGKETQGQFALEVCEKVRVIIATCHSDLRDGRFVLLVPVPSLSW